MALSDNDGVDDARCLWFLAWDNLPTDPNSGWTGGGRSCDVMPFVPLSSRASGLSNRAENGSCVSNFLSMFLRFHLLYQMRPPTPINKNATYPDALTMIALVKSFIVCGGSRSQTVIIACGFSVFLGLDGRRSRLDVHCCDATSTVQSKKSMVLMFLMCVKKSLLF